MSAAVPAMDSPSVAFAWFLETMQVERDGEVVRMDCALCSDTVCLIEAGDDLRVLLNTALQHTCPTHRVKSHGSSKAEDSRPR